jgi:hypothetical protein
MANAKMSAYGFCMDEKAGYFDLAFKLNAKASPTRWVRYGCVVKGTNPLHFYSLLMSLSSL